MLKIALYSCIKNLLLKPLNGEAIIDKIQKMPKQRNARGGGDRGRHLVEAYNFFGMTIEQQINISNSNWRSPVWFEIFKHQKSSTKNKI